jgi:hypothetical protein
VPPDRKFGDGLRVSNGDVEVGVEKEEGVGKEVVLLGATKLVMTASCHGFKTPKTFAENDFPGLPMVICPHEVVGARDLSRPPAL